MLYFSRAKENFTFVCSPHKLSSPQRFPPSSWKTAMIKQCPNCHCEVSQARNVSGPNFCPECRCMFDVPNPQSIQPWVWGTIIVLIVFAQITFVF